jgi:type II secretory pathway pseudopilin PulG
MVGAWIGKRPRPLGRSGITLTEILIAIMIMGIGLVSLATLFPIGLLRLRDAARYSRSATLLQTAASDATARGLLNGQSFNIADQYNYATQGRNVGFMPWFSTPNAGPYPPLTQDTPSYYGDWINNSTNPPTYLGANATGTNLVPRSGPGLPFAYDPLWRYQTISTANGTPGYYMGDTYEARFASGIGFIRTDSDGGLPSAHGLQRLTNFNRPFVMNGAVEVPIMPAALYVPNIFVSQEDLVWQDPKVNTYTLNGSGAIPVLGPSPVLPDLSPPTGSTAGGTPSLDWRFSWMFTGQETSSGNSSCFDGNIVIFEARQFGIQIPSNVPYPPGANNLGYQVDGETVVEGVFGYSNNVVSPLGNGKPGYGSAADRTVLLRWSDQVPDPVVRVGDWIADVTYERQFAVVQSRFLNYPQNNPNLQVGGLQNPSDNLEWDNLPAQRCFWYQVQKVVPASPDPNVTGTRSMTVYVNRSLVARTVLTQGTNGPTPLFLNAALIAPNVVNVIPQTIFTR